MSKAFEPGQRLYLGRQEVEFVAMVGEDRCVVADVLEFDGDDEDEDGEPLEELGEEHVVKLENLHERPPTTKIHADIKAAEARLAELHHQQRLAQQALSMSPEKRAALKSAQTLEVWAAFIEGKPIWLVEASRYNGTFVRMHRVCSATDACSVRVTVTPNKYGTRPEVKWSAKRGGDYDDEVSADCVFADEASARKRIAELINSATQPHRRDDLLGPHYPGRATSLQESMLLAGMDVPAWLQEACIQVEREAWKKREADLQKRRNEAQRDLDAHLSKEPK